ncbi:30S ribosomal protein S15 [Candidatus Phytoplasma phoenicium]|uniref:30S ribosomal protein S15 n=1 Tax=Candidatus Phytoplasma phoenicium TaxID=198422 RepID=A0A0L0MJM0_9MOLU|nr:30S ribosomal protein S15 [Candidatus Phytoplasma phoenicium]KND62543.1 30S ribosomal protein S15 [Candidatus Phytoplasma phoenicium]
MALTKEEKQKIIAQNTDKVNNTGDIKVQIAILFQEIQKLKKHLKKHPNDFQFKRGLLIKNRKRNALIRYAAKKNKI